MATSEEVNSTQNNPSSRDDALGTVVSDDASTAVAMDIDSDNDNEDPEKEEVENKKMSDEHHTTEDEEDNEPLSSWVLPSGAESIIRQIAAEYLLWHLMDCLGGQDGFPLSSVTAGNNTTTNNNVNTTRRPDFPAIRLLVEQHPGICARPYDFGWEAGDQRRLYPLAMICLLKPPLDLVKLILQAYPAALDIAEPTKGCIPLHYACSAEGSLDIVEYLLQQRPNSIQTARNDGMLPLHLACYFASPLHIVNCLLQAYPQAISMADNEDWTPLHAAARGNAPLAVVQRIYELNPAAIFQLDDVRRTPLHLVCMKKGDADVLEYLYNRDTAAWRVADLHSLTPLFHAAKCQSVQGLSRLLQLLNRAEPPTDPLGATILHFAIAANTADVVEWLLQTYPGMGTHRSVERMRYTALHVACLCDAPLANVQVLLRHVPETLGVKTGQGQTALQIARRSSCAPELIEYLTEEMKKRRC